MDPRILSRMNSWGVDFQTEMRKAKSLAEVYTLVNRIRRSDSRCGVPAAFFNPFLAWHQKQVGLAAGFSGNGRALVAGPGNCGDFQLECLAGRFDEVVLLDVDAEGPEIARQRLPEHLRGKVSVLVCDASAYVGRVVARAEEAIGRSSSGTDAAAVVRGILAAPPLESDLRPLPLESDSFSFVLSDDVLPNIYPLPIAWLDTKLKMKFGDDCNLSDGGQVPPIQLVAALVHLAEAHRILEPGRSLAVSASVAYVTVAVTPDNRERVVYCHEGPDGGLVLISAPRLGFDGERHVGLDLLVGMASGFSPVFFETYRLPLAEAGTDTIPGIGTTETFIAALHEFACLKKNG